MLEKSNKQDVINLVIRANNALLDYKFNLQQLRHLRQKNIALGVGTNDIKIKEDDIKSRMNVLKRTISTRVTLLLSWQKPIGKRLVFCEAFYTSDNQIQVQRKSITIQPISHFSIDDLNRKFITLTSVKLADKKLVLSDWVFDIRKGDLIPCKDIDTLIKRRLFPAMG